MRGATHLKPSFLSSEPWIYSPPRRNLTVVPQICLDGVAAVVSDRLPEFRTESRGSHTDCRVNGMRLLAGGKTGRYIAVASVRLMRPPGEEIQETVRLSGSHNKRNGCYYVKPYFKLHFLTVGGSPLVAAQGTRKRFRGSSAKWLICCMAESDRWAISEISGSPVSQVPSRLKRADRPQATRCQATRS